MIRPVASENEAYEAVVAELCADPAVVVTQMMGMPTLKADGKMFCGEWEGELVVKIGRDRVGELIAAGRAAPFDPSGRGRPMKDWALVAEPADDWLALAEEAREGVRAG
jgi:TfoX/Sxy family transcriptional regulator of competence genes